MKFIKVNTYGGVDWHDSFSKNVFLQENGSYAITNVDKTIVDYIVSFIADCINGIDEDKRNLINCIATREGVEEALKNKEKKFKLFSSAEHDYIDQDGMKITYIDIEVTFDAEKMEIEESYACGQCSYTQYIDVLDIAESDVRYIVCENFLCPTKGVPSIERMYQLPVKTQAEAEKIFSEMKLHKEEEYANVWTSSEKELLIDSVDNLLSSAWYANQVVAINEVKSLEKTIREYGNNTYDVPFAMYVDQHIKLVKDTKQEIWDACVHGKMSA